MAFYINPLALEAELNYIKTNCTEVYIVATYAVGDPVPTGTNILAKIQTVGDANAVFSSADFTIGNSGNARTLTFASGKFDLTANNPGTATHVVFCSATAVLLATTVTSQVIAAGNQVNFPTITYTSNQPA